MDCTRTLWRRVRFPLICWIFCCSLACSVFAQAVGSFATISGSVSDPDQKAVPNANVVVTNELNSVTRSANTDGAGRFAIAGLPVGAYSIEVNAPGFAAARSVGLRLAANGLENIAISLKVARVSEEVTVSEFLPLAAALAPSQSSLDARSAQSVISPQYIQNFTSPTAD